MKSHQTTTSARRFFSSDTGNFAINFGLAATLIFFAVGLAVDYTLALGSKTRINNALDAASLATAKALSVGDIDTENDEALDYFKAIFAANVGDNAFDSATYTIESFDTSSQKVSAEISIDQPLTFLRIGAGKTTLAVSSYSAAQYGVGTIEVAMVLDLSSSMTGSKFSALQDAAEAAVKELLSVNSDAETKARVSLVPYSRAVNVGPDLAKYVYADYNEATSDAPVYDPTLDPASASYDADADIAAGGHGLGYDVDAFQAAYKTNCYYAGFPDFNNHANFGRPDDRAYVMTAAFPGIYGFEDQDGFRPEIQPVGHRRRGTYTCFLEDDFVINDDNTNVDNCATERKAPKTGGPTDYQFTDANPASGMISRDSRLDEGKCIPAELVTLSSNETSLVNTINNWVVHTGTAGQVGLQWAWYTISHGWSDYLPNGSKPGDLSTDDDLAKYIILMTDGEFNRAYADNSDSSERDSSIALATASSLCTAIKADGITIFSIGFDLDETDAIDMLQACATPDVGDITYFYDPDTTAELATAFDTIVQTIMSLRLVN